MDALSYIYLMLQELEPMARDVGDAELVERLAEAKNAAADALRRMGGGGQSGD